MSRYAFFFVLVFAVAVWLPAELRSQVPSQDVAAEARLLDFMPPGDAARVERKMPGARLLDGGIRFLVTTPGEGKLIAKGDRVEAIYEGRLLDGTVFNRKTGRYHTYRFTVGAQPREIIEGWERAILHMRAGGRYRVAIPSQYAYRDKGRPGQVPPYSTVIFDLEILGVEGR